MKISRNTIISFILFVVVLAVYISTLCPTIYTGNSGEFVACATGNSLVKPVSHPTWYMIAKLFKLFSPGNPAYPLNLLSAVFGAWTVALTYVIVANIAHNRTTEETLRFTHLPYLRQICAMAGCLLLAFSPVFWETSVLAGPNTMKAFLFVLTTLFFLKYTFLRKKRYLLFFGLAYGIALANSPVMFLFLPVVFLLVFLWCREIFDDVVLVGIMMVLFIAGFLLPALAVPRSYISNPPVYLMPVSFSQALFYYIQSYFSELRTILPRSTSLLLIVAWVFLLIAPTFLPVIYLGWKKRREAAATAPATRVAVKYIIMLLFTVLGIAYLYGYNFYNYAYINVFSRVPPNYLIPLVFISSWMAYLIGYWMIMLAGTRTEVSSHENKASGAYSKPLYYFLILVVLALPIVSFSLNIAYEKSSKRNFTIMRDYCSDVLASTETKSLIVVPVIPNIKGTFDGFGNALRYVNTCTIPLSEDEYGDIGASERAIIDLPTAFMLTATNRIDLEKYIESAIWQDKDSSDVSRTRFADPKTRVYDRIIQEAARSDIYDEICFLHNHMIFDPKNEGINLYFHLTPKGVTYQVTPYNNPEYRPDAIIEQNRELWKNFSVNDYVIREGDYYSIETKKEKRFTLQGNILNNYSRLANDTGMFFAEQGLSKEASEYYELALKFNKDNYSAMMSLAQNLESEGLDKARIDNLRKAAEEIRAEQNKIIKEGTSAEQVLKDVKQIRETENLITTLRLVWLYGYVRDSDFYNNLVPVVYTAMMMSLPLEEREAFNSLSFKMLNLALATDPANPYLHFRKGLFLQSSPFFMQNLQAIIEYQTAIENGADDKRGILQAIGRIYGQIATKYINYGEQREGENHFRTAEKYFKQAIDEPSIESKEGDLKKAWTSDINAKFHLLDHYCKFRYNLDEAMSMAMEINKNIDKEERQIFRTSTDFVFRTMILQGKDDEIAAYVEDFAEKNPKWKDKIRQRLAELYTSQGKIKQAARIYERIKNSVEDTDGIIALTLGKRYADQEEWEKVIALDITARDPDDMLLSAFHLLKGKAYRELNQYPKATEQLELAFEYFQKSEDTAAREAMNVNKNEILNDLAYVYYLAGWPERNTAEGKAYLDKAFEYSRVVYDETRRRREISNPTVLLLWDTYAWVLHRHTEDKQEALSIMRRIYTGNPTHSQIAYHYGAILYDVGRTEEGLELIAKGYADGLQDYDEKEAAAILKENNIPLPEKTDQ